MKVLYVANYYDGTGYSHAAIEYILSLDAAGVAVVPRPIYLGQTRTNIPERIVELEKQETHDCDCCIQHTLPHLFDYSGGFRKNIGLFATETSGFPISSWAINSNMMDEIWVINEWSRFACKNNGITKPIKVVPHAIDVQKCISKPKIDDIYIVEPQDTYNFYYIGDSNHRKNIEDTIRAFHLAFTNNPKFLSEGSPNVRLIIKATGDNPADLTPKMANLINNVKQSLKLCHPQLYRKEVLITDRLTESEIHSLHTIGSCYVCTSFGEAWSIPAFEAWACGNQVIVPNTSPFVEHMNHPNALFFDTIEEPVYDMTDGFGDLYTGEETWNRPVLTDVVRCFEQAYITRDRTLSIPDISKLTRQSVGNLMKSLLGD